MPFWAKYGTQTTFEFPMIKRGVVDFAQTGDWTPASTDAAISKDLGNLADTTNTVAIVGGSPTRGASLWKITLTNTELTCARADVQIVDAATKAVEDQSFTVYTYGNASAFFAGDWSDLVRLGLTALPNAAAEAAGGLYTRGSGAGQINQPANGSIDSYMKGLVGTALTEGAAGRLKAAFTTFFDVAAPTLTTADVNQTGDSFARIGATGSGLTSLASAANLANVQADTDDIQSRLPAALTAGGNIKADTQVNSDKTGYTLANNGLDSGALTAAAKNAIADSLLDRNMATGTDSGTDSTATRTVRQALRILRNKVAIAAGTMTVNKEDDTTASWTAAITTTAGNPISAVDPT